MQIQVRDRGLASLPNIARLGEAFFSALTAQGKRYEARFVISPKRSLLLRDAVLPERDRAGLTATLTIPRDSSLASQRQ